MTHDIPLVISLESIEEGAHIVVASNVSIVNALFDELLMSEEIAEAALLSYNTDFYLAQVLNGGFSQFTFNSGGAPEKLLESIGSGLRAMSADAHADLFERFRALLDSIGPEARQEFLDSDGFEPNTTHDMLATLDPEFYTLNNITDLSELNAAWLLSRPELRTVPSAELEQFIESRVALIPDLEERRAAYARAREESMPEYERNIRALCEKSGHTLDRITAGDPTYQYDGERTLGWFFLTDQGLRVMVETDGCAIMVDGKSGIELVRLD